MSAQTPRRKRPPEPFDVGDFLRESDTDLKSALSSLLRSSPVLEPAPIEDPGLTIVPGPKLRQYPIREMKAPEDAHTRAEQFVYDYLWSHSDPLDEVSRKITIGLGALAKAVRLSESNARINARSLAAKLALEEYGTYNCEQSIGRTYRVFSGEEILRQRREAGLRWYMRRTLAVIFVDQLGNPVQLKARSQANP